MISERSESKTDAIFEILGPNKLFLDTTPMKQKLRLWNFDLLEVIWRPICDLQVSESKTNIIFGILNPKNLYFNTHEAKIDT